MSSFTARKLREVRESINITQTEAAKYMHMDERTLRRIESNEKAVTTDEIIQFSRIYRVDVRELLLEEYVEHRRFRLVGEMVIKVYLV